MTPKLLNEAEANLRVEKVVQHMTLFEVVLKVTFDGVLIDLSRRFPSAKFFIWCNRENDVIEVIVKDPDEYAPLIEEIRAREVLGITEESSDSRSFYSILHKCHCMLGNTIVRHIGTLDILNIFPNFMEGGWSYNRLVVFRHEDLVELLRRLDNWGWIYKIVRKVPFDSFIASSLTVSADALFSNLTEKQIDALVTAHRHGYYNLPRVEDVQTIAAKEKVPRTTFQEHLKKAENKLVAALVPYIQLFSGAPPEKRRSLRVKEKIEM